MFRKALLSLLASLFVLSSAMVSAVELKGVNFPEAKTIAGKELKLNGVALRKALGFIKIFAGGLYLENPTTDPKKAIETEQVKYFYLHYLTDLATAEKLQEGFIDTMVDTNPADLVAKHDAKIKQYASWLDLDMEEGFTSESIYVPGKGLTLIVNGVEKGTIEGAEFAQMYYRYSLGAKADSSLRDGYLGL